VKFSAARKIRSNCKFILFEGFNDLPCYVFFNISITYPIERICMYFRSRANIIQLYIVIGFGLPNKYCIRWNTGRDQMRKAEKYLFVRFQIENGIYYWCTSYYFIIFASVFTPIYTYSIYNVLQYCNNISLHESVVFVR